MARQYYYEHQAAIFRLASKDFDTKQLKIIQKQGFMNLFGH